MKHLQYLLCGILAAFVLWSCSMTVLPDEEDGVRNIWTTVVYMAADNDLEQAAMADFRELEAAVEKDEHTVLVLFDGGGCGDTRLYRVHHNSSQTGADGPVASEELTCPTLGLSAGGWNEVNMASPYVLRTVLDYADAAFPSENLSLIMWGYGTGFRSASSQETVCRSAAFDDTSGSSLSLTQLGTALSGRKLAFLGFDTSYGITLEQLYELKDSAGYIGGIPGVAPASGWDYTKLLNSWDMEYGKKVGALGSENGVIIDTAHLPELFTAFDRFSQQAASLVDSTENQAQVLEIFMDEAIHYVPDQYPCDVYVDVLSLAMLFDDDDLQQAIEQCCIASAGGWPGISVFMIAASGISVSVADHPAQYFRGGGDSGQCSFVRNSVWWCPTAGHRGKTLLDRLFYGAW